jgi:hypothetical protein
MSCSYMVLSTTLTWGKQIQILTFSDLGIIICACMDSWVPADERKEGAMSECCSDAREWTSKINAFAHSEVSYTHMIRMKYSSI